MKPHFLAAADRLPALTKKLSDIVKAKWPSSSVSAPFLPIAELSFGHLGSELPVRLGAELKIPASEVTKIIFNHLNETERQIFKIFDGFLNVELGKGVRTIPLSEISPLSLVQLKQIAIYISPLQEGETAFGFVRRAAVGALHRRLAAPCAADIKLFIGKELLEISPDQYWLKIFEQASLPPCQNKNIAQAFEESILQGGAEISFVWSKDELWQQQDFKKITEANRIIPQYFNLHWLNGSIGARDLNKFLDIIARNPRSAEIILSGTDYADDLDLSAIANKERANLHWYLGQTIERLSNLIPSLENPVFNWPDDKHLQLLVLRSLFIEDFMLQAAVLGQLKCFLTVLTELLDGTNRLLNTPAFRQSLNQAKSESIEIMILNFITKSLRKLEQEISL